MMKIFKDMKREIYQKVPESLDRAFIPRMEFFDWPLLIVQQQ